MHSAVDGEESLSYDENLTWITGLYGQALGCQADAPGKDYWTSKLEKGGSLRDVVGGFVEAQEIRTHDRPAHSGISFLEGSNVIQDMLENLDSVLDGMDDALRLGCRWRHAAESIRHSSTSSVSEVNAHGNCYARP